MTRTRKTRKHKARRPGVPCPHCDSPLSEVTRTRARGPVLQRVRRCLGCRKSFTTSETTAKTATGVTDLATGVTSLLHALESSPLSRLTPRK